MRKQAREAGPIVPKVQKIVEDESEAEQDHRIGENAQADRDGVAGSAGSGEFCRCFRRYIGHAAPQRYITDRSCRSGDPCRRHAKWSLLRGSTFCATYRNIRIRDPARGCAEQDSLGRKSSTSHPDPAVLHGSCRRFSWRAGCGPAPTRKPLLQLRRRHRKSRR